MSAEAVDAAYWVRLGVETAAAWKLVPPAELRRGPAGTHLVNRAGSSLDFHDYRAYLPGDDLRQVDWGVYARSDALVIRQYREEISPVLEILLDTSTSMGFYSGKHAAALLCASFLASLSRQAGGQPVLVADGLRHAASACEAALLRQRFTGGSDPAAMFHWEKARGRPLRVVISDFLFPAATEALLTPLRRETSGLLLVQILSESERRPSLRGGVRLRDAEDDGLWRDLRIDAGAAVRYSERLAKHLGLLDEAARRLNALLIRLDEPDGAGPGAAARERLADAFRRAGAIDVA